MDMESFSLIFSFWNTIELERDDYRKTKEFSKKPKWIFTVRDANNELQYADIILGKILSSGVLQILTDLATQSVA